jgi:hypothetical protein
VLSLLNIQTLVGGFVSDVFDDVPEGSERKREDEATGVREEDLQRVQVRVNSAGCEEKTVC